MKGPFCAHLRKNPPFMTARAGGAVPMKGKKLRPHAQKGPFMQMGVRVG